MELPEQMRTQLESVSNLPSPPSIAMAIMDLARDPDINLTAVAGLITKDPALASKILRTANSALFAQRRRSDNLRKALIVLGLNATLTLALSFTLVNGFRKQEVDGINLPEFWRHCLLSATAARVTGEVLGRTDTEDLFLGGLLQDIGVLAADKAEPGYYTGVPARFDHDELCRHEMERSGVDHSAFGAWLLAHWNMPQRLVDAVASSHQVTEPHDDGFNACVAMSGRIASFCLQPAGETDATALAQSFATTTGQSADTLGVVLMKLREQVPDIEELYESSLIEPARAELILDQAREILMLRNLQALASAETRTRQLEEANRRDALTGAYNRAHMMKILDQEFTASVANSWPLSVAFIDLDKFKQINDTHGHLAGDRLLIGLANALSDTLRDSDIVTRYGGDEFVVVMPGTDDEMATAAGARVTKQIATIRHDLGDGLELPVTISMGIASMQAGCSFESVEQLLAAADAAVYAVKQQGRNGFATWASLQQSGTLPEAPVRDYRLAEPDAAVT